MATLKEIKQRINNVQVSEKMTISMKNISLVKMIKLKDLYNKSKNYLKINDEVINSIVHMYRDNLGINDDLNNNFFSLNTTLPNLIVVLTSDRGLCGSFNNNIIKETEKYILELKKQNMKYLILPIGNKGKAHFLDKEKGFTEDIKFVIDSNNLTFENLEPVFDEIINLYYSGKIGSINIIGTEFKNILHSFVVNKRVVPFEIKESEEVNKNIVTDFDSISDIFDNIFKEVIKNSFYETILHSLLAENSTRVTAMDNAYNNAKDLGEKLSLVYNKTRQELITRELIEIVSGTEAL